MQRPPRRRRQINQCIRALLAHSLVHPQRLVDRLGLRVRQPRQRHGQHGAVFDSLRSALCEMRQGRVACVADEGDRLVHPGGQGLVNAQLPLADFTLRHVVQHALHHGAEVRKHAQHGGLGAAGGVGGIGGGGEVRVGLGGGEVVDGVVGDGVGDDMAFLADPAGYPGAVD